MDAAVEKLKHGPGEVVSFPEPEMSEEYRLVGMKVTHAGEVFRPDSAEAKFKIPAADMAKSMLELRNTSTDPEVKRLASMAITNLQMAVWAGEAAIKLAGVDPDLTDPRGR